MHLQMPLSVTIMILLRIFSMALYTVSGLAALVYQHNKIKDSKIAKELTLGGILGPFDVPPPRDNLRVPLWG